MGFRNILIIGMGFMGIALAKSIKNLGRNNRVVGFDLNKTLLSILLNKNIIDACLPDLNNIDNIDMIFLATPTSKFISIVEKIKDKMNNQTLVDIGSIKGGVIDNMGEVLGNKINLFVPTHPIAGGRSLDSKNIENEIERVPNNLFRNNLIHLFPSKINENSFDKVRDLFEDLGAKIDVNLTAKEHDKIYALTSHLPIFLAIIFLMGVKNGSRKLNLINKNLHPMNSKDINRNLHLTDFKDGYEKSSKNGDKKLYKYFVKKFNDEMWISVFFENIDNIEFWVNEVEKKMGDLVSQNDLSKILENIINANDFSRFMGKGCRVFLQQKNNKILISKKDFIESSKSLIDICKNKNIENLTNVLLTLMESKNDRK